MPIQSHMMNQTQSGYRTGSIYLVTLITVAAIVTMVLVGMRLRSSSNSQSALIETMTESNRGIQDATEYALQMVADHPAWMTLAEKGKAFDPMTVGETSYSSTLIDTDTMSIPTATTSNFRMQLTATRGVVSESAEIDFICSKVDYFSFVNDLGANSYWKLNESRGDASAINSIWNWDGDYLDPSITGTETNDEGAQVPLFNASNDHIEVPYDSDLKHSNGTFSLWMKTPGVTGLNTYGILGMQYAKDDNPALYLVLLENALYAFVNDSGSFDLNQEVGPSSTITPDTWHHIALTWGNDGLTIYLDGVESAKNTDNISGTGSARWNKGGEQPLKIGAANIGLSGNYRQLGFKGSIAHVVYFRNIQLPADKIAELAAIKPELSELSIVEGSWGRVFD